MQGFRSSLLLVLVAFGLLLVQSVFARVLSPYPFSPYLELPMVFALGTASGVRVVRGAATAFALGYLYDVFTGNPLGVHTFAFVVGYLAARLVAYLMSFRGVVFEMVLTFSLTLLVGGVVEVVRSTVPAGMTWSFSALAASLLASSTATALIAPLLFALVRRVDPGATRPPR
ncbi:MAG: rod shape-determining protein MreD [Myxococcota bacterium]